MTDIEIVRKLAAALPADAAPTNGNQIMVAVHDRNSQNTVLVHNRRKTAKPATHHDFDHMTKLVANEPHPGIPGHNAIIAIGTSYTQAIRDLLAKTIFFAVIGAILVNLLLDPSWLHTALGLITGAPTGAILHLIIHLYRHRCYTKLGEQISIQSALILSEHPEPFSDHLLVEHSNYTIVFNHASRTG